MEMSVAAQNFISTEPFLFACVSVEAQVWGVKRVTHVLRRGWSNSHTGSYLFKPLQPRCAA